MVSGLIALVSTHSPPLKNVGFKVKCLGEERREERRERRGEERRGEERSGEERRGKERRGGEERRRGEERRGEERRGEERRGEEWRGEERRGEERRGEERRGEERRGELQIEDISCSSRFETFCREILYYCVANKYGFYTYHDLGRPTLFQMKSLLLVVSLVVYRVIHSCSFLGGCPGNIWPTKRKWHPSFPDKMDK